MEEVPKFARLEIAIDDFINEQEDKNKRAKTDSPLESTWTIFI